MAETEGPIEQLLHGSDLHPLFLSPADRAGRWRDAFGVAAERVPEPYGLYGDDEQRQVTLGFPVRQSAVWAAFRRDAGRLVEAELEYRRALSHFPDGAKTALVELRRRFAAHVAGLLENALTHDYGQRLSEILWLAISAEVAAQVTATVKAAALDMTSTSLKALDEIRYTIAQRVAEAAGRGEAEALSRIRRLDSTDPSPAVRAFAQQLRDDVMPFAADRLGRDTRELAAYIQGILRLDPARFQQVSNANLGQLQALVDRDPTFVATLEVVDPDATSGPIDGWLYRRRVLGLLAVWPHVATPRLSDELRALLGDLGDRMRRFEVISVLRSRLVCVEERGARTVAEVDGRPVLLSSFTRPFDYTTPGVLTSVVRRYGLLYDLVEFTQLLEELRRQGRSTEEHALRMMAQFHARVDEIRRQYRLKFEKFLGDGAFYSARSARAVLLAGAELRQLYEHLRDRGFPFDRGLRLALNVGTYHLMPMVAANAPRPQFEFFGHGLTELARLTTGKRTHEADDIADFLVSCGYDVNKVISFLAPVREITRVPEHARDRAYAAYVSENGDLVNRGGIATEAFLQDLEAEWAGRARAQVTAWGVRWLLLPCGAEGELAPWVGLRPLGTARLKGLEPIPLAEVVVFQRLPAEASELDTCEPLLVALQRMGGDGHQLDPPPAAVEIEPTLCVVSVLDAGGLRSWTIGRFSDEGDALEHAFRIRLNPVGLTDGEPFEAWLFQRRADLARLYNGLRRDGDGDLVALDTLRGREGYFACLLAAPHRSPR